LWDYIKKKFHNYKSCKPNLGQYIQGQGHKRLWNIKVLPVANPQTWLGWIKVLIYTNVQQPEPGQRSLCLDTCLPLYIVCCFQNSGSCGQGQGQTYKSN
jgi:hypothetical protein